MHTHASAWLSCLFLSVLFCQIPILVSLPLADLALVCLVILSCFLRTYTTTIDCSVDPARGYTYMGLVRCMHVGRIYIHGDGDGV